MTNAPSNRKLLVIGANHRSSSMALRDKLFINDAAQPGFFARLKSAGFSEAVLVSTCDRVEVVAVHDDPNGAAKQIRGILADHAGVHDEELNEETYAKEGNEAVRHLFAVTASLDSVVLGEPQVLGQIKASHRSAKAAGLSGPEIDRYLGAAYNVAKRIRHETEIGHQPVSIAAAALQAARDLHGRLDTNTGLLIGTGEMGEVVAEALKSGGLGDLVITHTAPRRAEALGQRLDCHIAAIKELPQLLAKSDIVLTAMNTRQYIVQRDDVVAALKQRRHKPIFLIDTGIPGDIEPALDSLADAFHYTLDDLERITREGRANRKAESEAAWRIIDYESATFRADRLTREAIPAVRALRQHFEAEQAHALAEADGDANRATQLLINRLLHSPSQRLRELASQEGEFSERQWETALDTLNRLFGIKPEDNLKQDTEE